MFEFAATNPSESKGWGAMFALGIFIVASGYIGVLANRAMRSTSFMKGFFLGNRGLGAWAMALTATVQSGGTFMGFPSLVYTHGYIVAVWIGSYMIVPITGFAILGKRLAQLSRRTGAITIPDLFRERFGSPLLGLVASLSILFYISFMMAAQFKAGAIVMKLSWPGSGSFAMSEEFTDFEMSRPSWAKLAQGRNGLPAEIHRQIEPLVGVNYKTQDLLEDALKEKLSPADYKKYQAKIIESATPIDWLYLMGLAVFTLTVVGYTMAGGFLAAVWTDLFQSIMMFFGVLLLLLLCLTRVGGLEQATRDAVKNTSAIAAKNVDLDKVAQPETAFITGPGFDPKGEGRQFLPVSLAFSFFVVWVFSGVSSPASIVRIMASDSTATLRRSIYLLSVYNCFIYIPLIVICVCGRSLIPDLKQTDEIIPRLALMTTSQLPGGTFLGGLILAAPFGAIMATVSCYLVVLASGLVRDVYQRLLNPHATEQQLRSLSRWAMVFVGAIAVAASIKPVQYLQALVVFSSTGAATTFLIPAIMACYWRRATVAGILTAMLSGAATTLVLYVIGILDLAGSLGLPTQTLMGAVTTFRPYYWLGLDPMIWGLLVSSIGGIGISLVTKPIDPALISRMFDREIPPEAPLPSSAATPVAV